MKPQTKTNFDSLFKFSQISVTLNKTENRLVWKLKVREVIAYSVLTKQFSFFGRHFRVFIHCKSVAIVFYVARFRCLGDG